MKKERITLNIDKRDTYVMLVSATNKSFVIPLIKNDNGTITYIDGGEIK